MFGSISEKGDKIIEPLFWGYEMCNLPELTSFLCKQDFQDKSNTFNEILEGSEVTRDILKFGNATEGLLADCAGRTDGLTFDGRSLHYIPNTCFVIGTRPLENKTYTYLEQSGFWSRFHTIQIEITDEMASDIFTGSFKPSNVPDIKEMKGRLLFANQRLLGNRKTIANRLDYEEVLLPVLQSAKGIIEMKAKTMKTSIAELINTRLKGDIAREANAYRILTGASNKQILDWLSGRLPHFFDFNFNPIIAKELTVKTNPYMIAFAEISAFTKDTEKSRKEIVAEMDKQGISRATTDRVLKDLNEKKLNKGNYGAYKI